MSDFRYNRIAMKTNNRRIEMDIIIREIEEKDYPAVASLLTNELWDGKINDEHVVPFFNKTKDSANYVTFVALLDEKVIGLISATMFLWAATEKGHMLIQGLVVQNEYRNSGVGTKLLKHLEDFATTKKIYGIGLCSGFQRTAAHVFYEGKGYSRLTQYFGKNI